ncbi:hypothetical protein [Rubrivirga sp.]|uniref:hypothetical protein n=1 Tax=Rubrivirga sp. TaxID=1885344 RepID=UPI003C76E8D4
MTLDEFRSETAGWLDRAEDDFECVAWKHEPGRRPEECALEDADALSVPRAEAADLEDGTASAPAGQEPVAGSCTLAEMKVVYRLAQLLLGFRGAVQPSANGTSWNVYRDE